MGLETLAVKAVGLVVALVLLRVVLVYFTSPLKAIPGPFLAQFTDFWRCLDYWNCTQIKTHQKLHEEHGGAVRVGPNLVSLGDPSLIKTVFSTRGDFVKVCRPGC